ncbi:unnamed protein product [Chironomus riparius]|uniref:N-acetyltransferase domain-containing protein n=1 Tax=Chironomus riparius TaxID=315576 RepID=A0A9N9RU39_9DIPT|nr:unnamed protein product [Chironomus riparius]
MNSKMFQLRRLFSSVGNLKTYRKFRALDLDGKTEVEYRIQDYPKDRIEEGIQFNAGAFLKHEPMSKTRNVINQPDAVEEFLNMLRTTMQNGKSLACFKENSDEIISTNILAVKDCKEYMAEPDFKNKDLLDIFGVMNYANKQFSPFKHYNVDHILYAFTVGVKPNYTRRGIANHMFQCRRLLCKELGLKVTTTHATANGSQKAALNAGFEENFSIEYSDLLKINPKFNFPNIDTKCFKVLSLKV